MLPAALTPQRAWFGRIPPDVRLFLAFLVLLAPVKALQTGPLRWMNIDGGYYTEVARHVRDGLGLTTHVSLNNFGYESFPHPTSIYPLWPVVLGMTGRVVDLTTAAHWLPAILYFVSIIGAFGFGRSVWPAPVFPSSGLPINGGHIAAALLAFNRQFIVFTSVPYTEGLSWALFFLFFWRLSKKSAETSAIWGVELGLWLSALYFARSQFIVIPLAVGGALFLRLCVGPDRMRWLRVGATAAAVTGTALGAWLAHLSTFVADLGPTALVRFDQNRANDLLAEFDVIVETDGALDLLTDRLSGLGTAYSPAGAHSWHGNVGTANWALPVAGVFALVALRRPVQGWWARRLASIRSDDAILRGAMLLVAVGGLLSVHLAHKHFNGDWYFYRRQGLIAIFAFLLPLMWLLRRKGAAALFGGAIVASSIWLGIFEAARQIKASYAEAAKPDPYADLVGWLAQNSAAEAPITVAFQEGTVQRVAWRTEHVGYHWLSTKSPYADVRTMFDKLHTDYLILDATRRVSWRLWRDGSGRVEAEFERVPGSPPTNTILRTRTQTPPPPVSRKVLLVGVDGANWKVMGPMVKRGELPTFRRLWSEGASAVELDAAQSSVCPAVWTTITTGRSAVDHGVSHHTEKLADGTEIPVTSNRRKVPALWNVASALGVSVGLIHWPATWPAEPVLGTVVTDHDVPSISLSAAQVDQLSTELAVRQLATGASALTLVHLGNIDAVQHAAWDRFQPFAFSTPAGGVDATATTVEGAYRELDRAVAELMAAAGPDTTVIVVSDHGASPCSGAAAGAPPGCHTKANKGLLFIHGPGVAGSERLKANELDVFPTMAWIAGLPISAELTGRPLSEAFLWEYAARFGRTDVPGYGERVPGVVPSGPSPADGVFLERLRQLGEIK